MVDGVIGKAIVQIVGEDEGLSQSLDNAKTGFENALAQITKLGAAMTASITVPLTLVGKAIGGASIQFESAFAGVAKTVDATEAELKRLEEGIINMSRRLPFTASEIARVAAAAGQLGVGVKDIELFTETMLRLGISTNLTAEDAAIAFARLASQTALPLSEVDRLGSAVVALGNNFATTESEIVEMSLRFAGVATQIGITADETAAFAAVLSQAGLEAQAGGGAMQRVLSDIALAVSKGGSELAAFAEVAGMSADEFRRAFKEDATEAILAFLAGLNRIQAGGGDVIQTLDSLGLSQINNRRAVLGLTSQYDELEVALSLARGEMEGGTALLDESARQFDTTASRIDVFKDRLAAAALMLRDTVRTAVITVIDALNPFVTALEGAAGWFSKLDPNIQLAVIALAGLAAAIGPVLAAVGLFATTALPGLVAAFGLLSSPITGTVALIAGLAAGITAFIATNEKARDALKSLWEEIKETVGIATAAMAKLWKEHGDEIQSIVKQAFELIKAALEAGVKIIANLIGLALNTIQGDFKGAWQNIQEIVKAALELIITTLRTFAELGLSILGTNLTETESRFKAVWQAITEFLKAALNRMLEALKGALTAMRDFSETTWQNVENKTRSVWDGILRSLDELWQRLENTVRTRFTSSKDAIVNTWQALEGFFQRLWQSIQSIFERAQSAIGSVVDRIRGYVSDIQRAYDTVRDVAGKISDAVGRARDSARELLNLPGAQRGGIIQRPGLAIVGERGPEILSLPKGAEIIPLTGGGQARAPGGITLMQELHVDASPADLQRYTERALRKLAIHWEVV